MSYGAHRTLFSCKAYLKINDLTKKKKKKVVESCYLNSSLSHNNVCSNRTICNE